jgi:hypothetical protein
MAGLQRQYESTLPFMVSAGNDRSVCKVFGDKKRKSITLLSQARRSLPKEVTTELRLIDQNLCKSGDSTSVTPQRMS